MRCRYIVEDRTNRYNQTLGNVRVSCFQYDDIYGLNKKEWLEKLVDELPSLEPVQILKEPCNCEDSPRCNDGGNYHSIIELYQITPCISLALYKDTRELFNVEERLFYIIEIDDKPTWLVLAKSFETIHLLKKSELTWFIKRYQRRNYIIYTPEEF